MGHITSVEEEKKGKDVFGDYATLKVPEAALKTTFNLFMVYLGVLAVIAAIFAGSGLAQMFDLKMSIAAAFIGSAGLAIFGALIAYIGGTTKANTYMILRYPLGRIGAIIGSLIVSAIPMVIWYAVETWLFGITVNVIYPENPLTSIAAASIWGGLLMMLTTYYGYWAMSLLSIITVPFWYVFLVIGFYAAIDAAGGFSKVWTIKPETAAPLSMGIAYVFGVYAAGSVASPDIARYGVKRWSGPLAWALHVLFFMPLLLFIGDVMTRASGSPNVIVALPALGLGLGALLLAILGQWTTNEINLWSSSLAWINITGKFHRKVWVIILGTIGTLIAGVWGGLWGMSLDPFINFALMLSYFIPPVGAVMIADYYIFRPYVLGLKDPETRYVFGPGTRYYKINIPGIIAVLAGGSIAWYTSVAGLGYSVLNGIISAFILYLALIIPMEKAGIKWGIGEWVESEIGV